MGVVSLDRRQFVRSGIALAGLGLVTACGIPLVPLASSARPRRVGYLASGTPASAVPSLEALRQGLRDHGYVEGETVTLEVRYANGREEAYQDLARELVRADVEVIVVSHGVPAFAVQGASDTMPIVFATINDPVRVGLVASLARPGGNATGLTLLAGEENAKRVQILKETVPDSARVAVLWNAIQSMATQSTASQIFAECEAAGRALGLDVLSLPFTGPDELDALLATAMSGGANGLIITPEALFSPLAPRIIQFAASNRLPAIYPTSTYAVAGGLLVYGPNITENWRRSASYVDRILKGAKPADLPVERPSKIDFIVNLKTARELGLTIPRSVLQQVTEIVE